MIELARRRWDAGLTPEQLGDRAGVSGMTIRRIEQGKGTTPATLKKLGDYFGCAASELLRDSQPEAA